MNRAIYSVVALLPLLGACGSDDPPADGDGGADAATDSGQDAGAGDSGANATLATVSGSVTWDATEPPGWDGDGVGDLIIAVFATDPTGGIPGLPVAFARFDDVDVQQTPVAYEVTGIPPRPEPYFLSAFLDDDENGGPVPAPDQFDAVALTPGTANTPEIVLDSPGVFPFDLVLNFILPTDL